MRLARFPSVEIILDSRFVEDFQKFLHGLGEMFHKEEGGYLLGVFRSPFVLLKSFSHDNHSDGDAASIRLSERAFYEAETKALSLKLPSCKVIGTWHLHPPSFGAGYSSVDASSLFVDRILVNALDPGDASCPWIHVIVPGTNLDGLNAYTLDVATDLKLNLQENRIVSSTRIPKGKRFGLVIRSKHGSSEKFLPILTNSLSRWIRSPLLSGFWRIWPEGLSPSRWDYFFLENFLRKLAHSRGDSKAEISAGFTGTYVRLQESKSGSGYGRVDYGFEAPVKFRNIKPVRIRTSWQPATVLLRVEDPLAHFKSVTSRVTRNAKLRRVIENTQKSLQLIKPPSLWAHMKRIESASGFAEGDSLGRTDLPPDMRIGEFLANVDPSHPTLYLNTFERPSTFVRKVLSNRSKLVGYDVESLSSSHLVIAGAGILGSELALTIGVIGVGRVIIIDRSNVGWDDIYRQQAYGSKDVGENKANILAGRLQEMGINATSVCVEIPCLGYSSAFGFDAALNILEAHLKGSHLVVGSLDSFSARCVLQILCRRLRIPFLSTSVDTLKTLRLVQGSIGVFARGEGCCYMCGTRMRAQADAGACTLSPVEFSRMVAAVAGRSVLEILSQREKEHPAYLLRINSDFSIEKAPLSEPAAGCELCQLSEQSSSLDVSSLALRIGSFLNAKR